MILAHFQELVATAMDTTECTPAEAGTEGTAPQQAASEAGGASSNLQDALADQNSISFNKGNSFTKASSFKKAVSSLFEYSSFSKKGKLADSGQQDGIAAKGGVAEGRTPRMATDQKDIPSSGLVKKLSRRAMLFAKMYASKEDSESESCSVGQSPQSPRSPSLAFSSKWRSMDGSINSALSREHGITDKRLGMYTCFSPTIVQWDLIRRPQQCHNHSSAWCVPAALVFVDISGFTRLCNSLEISVLRAVLRDYTTRLVDMVSECSGDVLRFVGDALL